jgi:hypothetical protein
VWFIVTVMKTSNISCIKFLGIYIDSSLLWKNHIKDLSSMLIKDCYAIRAITPLMSLNSMLGGSPCHHSKARPQVADGRVGLQHWRLAVNILNKQPRTNDKGWYSSLGVWANNRSL